MADFVHLHVHSEYSLLDGACRIADIPKKAKELDQSAVAITDHGVMYGAVAFYKACADAGVKPIIGCEVYVAPRTRFDKTHGLDSEYYHLVLLVKNEIGYKNLIYMVSKSNTEGFYIKPRVDDQLLAEHSEGLIALSGCLAGKIARLITSGQVQEAENYAVKLDSVFGRGNFYLELQDHGIAEQKQVNEALYAINKRTGIPLIATNDAHYINKNDSETQAVLTCIQTGSVITEGRPLGFETDEFYFKSSEEMSTLFARCPEAIENTVRVAEMCNFDFDFKKQVLPTFTPPDGKDPKKYLRELALEGLERRLSKGEIVYTDQITEDDYKKRIEYELVVITSMGYSEYYLIVADFVNYAKSKMIPTGPGRGSGAGSLIAYLIAITEVDPVKYGLLFESFLNPQRISMPDFDIDFCDERREEVIQYVAEKYGEDHVSQITTFGTLAARAAVRDVGRALGMPYGDVDAVARAIPQKLGITLTEALQSDELKKLYESGGKIKNLIDISLAVEGMPRHASTHAAGVVITDKPLYEYVPLSVNGGNIVTQYDMDTIASLGLLKFDFLALRYLTIIDDTVRQIKKTETVFSIDIIPLDDEETFALISKGKTDGVFQLESAGMKVMLQQFCPTSVQDIMIAIALYRPGPMEAIPVFLKNRRDMSQVKYPLPELGEILNETCGCIVYQEQVMQIFRTVAGYSYGKADIVRRAIAKKKAGVIEKELDTFIEGAKKKGVAEEDARKLFDDMTGFANYGFKKSHAAAYAVTSYRTAYLKTHYTAAYYAALISSVLGNQPKMCEYIGECSKYGISVLPPDINESDIEFTVSNGNIRFGLLALKSVGEQFLRRIVEERKNGNYTSFYNFISRMSGSDLNKRMIEALIKAGTFDSLGEYRSRLLSAYENMIDMFVAQGRNNLEGQIDFFGNAEIKFTYPDIPEMTLKEKLSLEKESAGMYFSGHLLDGYQDMIEKISPASINAIIASFADTESENESALFTEKQIVKIAGIITRAADKATRNGDMMRFLTVEDRYSEIEVIVFPKQLKQYESLLVKDRVLCIEGEINLKDGENAKLILKSACRLEEAGREEQEKHPPIQVRKNREPEKAAASYPISSNGAYPEAYMRFLRPDNPETISKQTTHLPPQNTPREKILYLRVPDMEGKPFKKAINLIEIFDGSTKVVLYNSKTQKYMKTNLGADAGEFLLRELSELLGKENVILK